MNYCRARPTTGFTLIELLVTLTVLGIILAAAVPGFSALADRIRMNSNISNLSHSFHRARQNSRVTGVATVVCASTDGATCDSTGTWQNGWLVFANTDGDEPPQVDAGEQVLTSGAAIPNLRIAANRRAFIMRPFGLRSTNGTLVWCDRRGSDHARAVIVSYTGKPRVSRFDASGNPLVCTT
jgi:type IV fimbrial biogenesis protein FimT